MILSDQDIINEQRIWDLILPFDKSHVQPASYELTLAKSFRKIKLGMRTLDPRYVEDYTEEYLLSGFTIQPLDFVLASTVETVDIRPDLAAEVRGKSSLGRLGLQIHATAGWIDPGYKGTITLELFNCGSNPIRLTSGMMIAQLAFYRLENAAQKPYGHSDLNSKYQNSKSTVAAR